MIILNRNVEMLSVEDIIDDSRELNIDEVTEYILAIPKFAEKIGTENLKLIMERLGDPQDKVRAVHVAGTNGKGSTTEMLRLMLTESGFRTGSFTSPHLVKINERISIDGRMISDEEFILCFRKVMKAISDNSLKHPSFFEFIFAIAALYFAEQGADFVVYETGMGGRLDATNIITPVVSVITSIGMDHMQYLGDTIREIAGEKAGIIKPGIPVIYNTGDKEADEVIEAVSEKLDSVCYTVGCLEEKGFLDGVDESVFEAVSGYEKENARTALLASKVLLGERFDPKQFSSVIREFSFPGRLEYVKRNILLDGAHNEDAVKALIKSVNEICMREGYKHVSLFFAVSSDKDYNSIIRLLADGLDIEDVYVSELNSSRREDAGTVMKLFQKYLPAEKSFDVVASRDMKKLWKTAVGELRSDTLLLVVGSLYMVGEIKGFL